jgi:hypothetical protein
MPHPSELALSTASLPTRLIAGNTQFLLYTFARRFKSWLWKHRKKLGIFAIIVFSFLRYIKLQMQARPYTPRTKKKKRKKEKQNARELASYGRMRKLVGEFEFAAPFIGALDSSVRTTGEPNKGHVQSGESGIRYPSGHDSAAAWLFLSQTKFAACLGPEVLSSLVGSMEFRSFELNECVFTAEADTKKGVYVVVRGMLGLMSTSGALMTELSRGDSFGEAWLIDSDEENGAGRMQIQCRALLPTQAYFLPRAQFDKLSLAHPRLHFQFVRTIIYRFLCCHVRKCKA